MVWSVSPPQMTKLEIPVGSIYPPNDNSDLGYWLTTDTYYVVTDGAVQFQNIQDDYPFIYGDLYWVMAGHRHGSIICIDVGSRSDTSGYCTVMVMSTTV